jgi:cytochrome c
MKSIVVCTIVATGLIVSSHSIATEMPQIAKNNNCSVCHAIDKKIVGPAWMDVSNKYKGATTYTYRGKEYPLFEGVIMKVSKGGSGNWGSVPMPPNAPAVNEVAIRELAKFVLSLAK